MVHIGSTTIADNTAEQVTVVVRDSSSPVPNVHLRNSIVSGGTELQLTGSRDGWELDHGGVTSTYSLWNGVSDEFAGFLDHTGTGNIVNVDPQLGGLADNGGFTQTRLPAADGPVIDAGDPDPTGTPDLDQRGAARINGVIDMGSVEVGTLGEPGDGEPGDGEPGDGEPGDGEPGDGEPGDGEPGDGEPGDGGAQSLPATGASGAAGLLTFGGILALAGLVLLLGRLRRLPN